MSEGSDDRGGAPLIALAVTLAFASGATDVASFVRLGTVFSSVMTGNLVLLGLAAERTSGQLAAHTGEAIAIYVAGVALGSRVCCTARHEVAVWSRAVTVTLAMEVLALVAFSVGWELSAGHPAASTQFGILPFAALSMGLQAAAVRTVSPSLSTTYLTGTLTATVTSVMTGARVDAVSLSVLGPAAVGAAAGGGLIAAAPPTLPLLPLGAVAAVVVAATTVGVRQ